MPRSHFALFQKYFVGTNNRTGQPWSGVSGPPSASYTINAFSSSIAASGEFAVKPASAWAMAKCALGFGLHSFAISRQCTPLKWASKRLQRVTQWMSLVTSVAGSAVSSSKVSVISFSTSPHTRRSHAARSTFGTSPACSTGHFSVRYCPGGSLAGSKPAARTLSSAFERKSGIAFVH